MSSKNRARRELNRDAKASAEQARRIALKRRFALIALALISLPLCVFAATKAMHSGTHRVVVNAASANAPSANAPSSSASSPTSIRTSRRRVIRPLTGTSTVTYITHTPRYSITPPPASQPVTAAQPVTAVAVTPQPVIRYLPAPTSTSPPLPPSKPCVGFKDTLAGGGSMPIPVGPAPTKLVVRDLVTGTGAVVQAHTTLTVDYVAVACSTGKIVDASYQHGGDSTLQLDNVIGGWQLGMPGARVGGTRLLGVPAALAYGAAGRPPIIGKDEALWFQVTVKATDVKIGVPSAPTNVVATPQVGAAKLTWTVPNDNGAPITQYVISTYVNGNLQAQQTAYTTAASMTITSLTAGATYTFKVAARNSYGAGPQSAASNSCTPT
jgi:hypothetical protein